MCKYCEVRGVTPMKLDPNAPITSNHALLGTSVDATSLTAKRDARLVTVHDYSVGEAIWVICAIVGVLAMAFGPVIF